MKQAEQIFDLLKSIRMEAMKNGDCGLLRAVVKAEDAALTEICGVNTQADGDTYAEILNEDLPIIEARLV